MLRVFGFYSFGECDKNIVHDMANLFETKSRFTKFMSFNQGNILLNYEMVNSNAAKNFYFIDTRP